jgi:hypothetical protein
MKNIRTLMAAAILVMSAGCSVTSPSTRLALVGDAASITAAERTIVITPQTQHVNVTGGEIVRFDVGAKSFAWHFDGALNVTQVSLQQIAPTGILDHAVTAYVQPNPFFMGGDMN